MWEIWLVARDIRLISGRKEGHAHNEASAKIESMSTAEEARAPQTLVNEYGVPPVKWVLLNKLVPESMEYVVGMSIAERGQALSEQVTEDEGEGEGKNRGRSQKIWRIILPTGELAGWSKWSSK
jgi:hypothetical protein